MSLSQQQTFACFPVKAKQLCNCRPRNSTGRLETHSLREDNAVLSLPLTLCSSALIQCFCFRSKTQNKTKNQRITLTEKYGKGTRHPQQLKHTQKETAKAVKSTAVCTLKATALSTREFIMGYSA